MRKRGTKEEIMKYIGDEKIEIKNEYKLPIVLCVDSPSFKLR